MRNRSSRGGALSQSCRRHHIPSRHVKAPSADGTALGIKCGIPAKRFATEKDRFGADVEARCPDELLYEKRTPTSEPRRHFQAELRLGKMAVLYSWPAALLPLALRLDPVHYSGRVGALYVALSASIEP